MTEHTRLIGENRRLRKIASLLREQAWLLATLPFLLGNPEMDRYRELSAEIEQLKAEESPGDTRAN